MTDHRHGFQALDILLCIALLSVGAAVSLVGSSHIDPGLYEPEDVWFQADLDRVYANMTERWSDHYRSKVHPLFSLATNPIVRILSMAGVEKPLAVRLLISTASGILVLTFFIFLRLTGLRAADASIYSLLLCGSSALVFWTAVPETYVFGSVTVLLPLIVLALAARIPVSSSWILAANAASLSMTVTNWMSGLVSAAQMLPLRKAMRLSLDAFVLVVFIWAVQKFLYPSSEFFLAFAEEISYIGLEEYGGPLERARSFLLHAVITPDILVMPNQNGSSWPFLSIQFAGIGSAGNVALAATVVWTFFLIAGTRVALTATAQRPLLRAVLLVIAGQFLLHMVYGDETFLYSLHWTPLLVFLAALTSLTRHRPYFLTVSVLLLITIAVSNFQQFTRAAEIMNSAMTSGPSERKSLARAISDNPLADWPRGSGHAILAKTGTRLSNKGYHEPGGSFSPGFASFGVSFLLLDSNGNVVESSNSIELSKLEQKAELSPPRISTRSGWYTSTWIAEDNGRFLLEFKANASADSIVAVKVGSAGPSGGAVRIMEYDSLALSIGDQASMNMSPGPRSVALQDERASTLESEVTTSRFESADGFASAWLILDSGTTYKMSFTARETTSETGQEREAGPIVSTILPDKRFQESLDAQIFHLRAGLVNDETRPGDPANYPLNWLRDGAYSIVALTRAGDVDIARLLTNKFIENDFFGGFGAEADGPGLAIWALDEVATRLNQKEYDDLVWPAIKRKAAKIIEMLDAKESIFEPFVGPIVPEHRGKAYGKLARIADRSKDGLIVGKMDDHSPIFYVNAVSYLGLTSAAHFASRIGYEYQADTYRSRAATLRQAWNATIKTNDDRFNVRTAAVGLWPSMIVDDEDSTYLKILTKNRERDRDADGRFIKTPLWTYFDIAEAHQWIIAGRPELAWQTIEWFWGNQASPGLFTWWEGDREENSFGLWEKARGWIAPRHVTPHYWTAAEMLLLQIDMLAFVDDRADRDHIVIGAGVPKSWITEPMSASNLRLRNGLIGWTWDGQSIHVRWSGDKSYEFVPGPDFRPVPRFGLSTNPSATANRPILEFPVLSVVILITPTLAAVYDNSKMRRSLTNAAMALVV